MSASLSVLGAFLLGADPHLAETEDFFLDSHKRIHRAMLHLHDFGVPIDLVTVSDRLKTGRDADGLEPLELSRACEYAGTTANVKAHVGVLKRERQMRELKQGAMVLMQTLDEQQAPESVRDVLSRLSDRARDTLPRGPRHVSETIGRFFLVGNEPAVPLGLVALDGLRVVGGELCVVAARPGQGKTALLGTIALAAAREGWQVLFASLEMPAVQIHARLLAAVSGLALNEVLCREAKALLDSANKLSELRLWVEDETDATFKLDLEGLDALTRVFCEANQDRHTVLLVDYLQYVRTRARYDRRHELLGHVCRGLKRIARVNNIPVIAAAQLNRAIENRGVDPRPQLSDLRESGEIENNADQVLLMHRNELGARAQMLVAKYRQGQPFLAEAYFDGPRCQFADLSHLT